MGDEEDLPEEDLPEEDFDEENESPQILTSLLRQIYCCSSALLLPFFGAVAEQGVFINYNERDFEMSFIAGEVVGFISGGIFISILGRKLALILSNFSFLLITSASAFAYDNDLLFFPVLIGFLLRFSMIAFIFYVAEISGITFRAIFFASYNVTSLCGELLVKNMDSISLSIGAVAVLVLISSLMSLFVPETPYYLASKGDLEGAEDIFTWIRADERNILEYDLMLDKAQNSMEVGEILTLLSSSSFFVSILLCFLLKICNCSGCELYQSLLRDYIETLFDPQLPAYMSYTASVYLNDRTERTLYVIAGSLVFICISFVIPRKIIYGLGFVFTLLLVIPVALTPEDQDFVIALFPYCYIISYAGREPLTLLLPIEIFPATIRNVGLIIVFILEKAIQVLLFFTSEEQKKYKFFFKWKRAGKSWSVNSYYASLIGVPFLLYFMPETKGRSLFEIDEVGLSIRGASESQVTEESIAE